MRSVRRIILALSVAGFLACVVACGGGPPQRGSTEPGARPAASQAETEERAKIIQELIASGIVKRVEASKDPSTHQVWVTPKFMTLDYDDKFLFMSVVAGQQFRVPKGQKLQTGEMLLIVDSKTGKSVGHFDENGLSLD